MRYKERRHCVFRPSGLCHGVFSALRPDGFRRNLSSGDHGAVLYYARQWPNKARGLPTWLLWVWGTFNNYDATLDAIDRLNTQRVSIGARRITISTLGAAGIRVYTRARR